MTEAFPMVVAMGLGLAVMHMHFIVLMLRDVLTEIREIKRDFILEAKYLDDEDDSEAWKRT